MTRFQRYAFQKGVDAVLTKQAFAGEFVPRGDWSDLMHTLVPTVSQFATIAAPYGEKFREEDTVRQQHQQWRDEEERQREEYEEQQRQAYAAQLSQQQNQFLAYAPQYQDGLGLGYRPQQFGRGLGAPNAWY